MVPLYTDDWLGATAAAAQDTSSGASGAQPSSGAAQAAAAEAAAEAAAAMLRYVLGLMDSAVAAAARGA